MCKQERKEEQASERMRILRMLQEGKITPEEAAKLLEALGKTAGAPQESAGRSPAWWRGKHLRIHVEEKGSKEKVDLKVPMAVVAAGGKLGSLIPGGIKVGGQKINLSELLDGLSEAEGDLVSVDEEEGDKVRIWIE
jgi:hypothetical protein